MSCLNLRLPPARKVWKSFTSKIQSKLHKPNKPKAIRKSRNRLKLKTTSNTTPRAARPYKFIEQRYQSKRCLLQSTNRLHLLHEQRNTFIKYPDPVYIDKLFKEPVSEQVVKFQQRTKNLKPGYDQPAQVPVAGASKEAGRGAETTPEGDDMWESMGFPSPQMHGIDERAEEFITRFRAQMNVQEMLARDLWY